MNPIQVKGIQYSEPEAIGKHLIKLYKNWKPSDDPKIGSLYGFDLYIRQHKEPYEDKGSIHYKQYNTFYAERPESGIKYTFSQGHPNTDNPKLAARHFLNAIDRVGSLKEKYEKTLGELNKDIPMVEQIVAKPFEKEPELAKMKSEMAKLEREITLKIQENQMKQSGAIDQGIPDDKQQEYAVITKTPVIQLNPKEHTAMQMVPAKTNGMAVNGKEAVQSHLAGEEPRLRRNSRLRL